MNINNSNNRDMGYRPSILIVEDSALQALKTKSALESNGCRVDWADTGYQGLDLAQHKHFDLIVLDIELPDINGFEICRTLKTNPKLADIPVIMLTTLDRADDAMHGIEAGAIDYIPKDIFADTVLVETIKQMGIGRT